MKQEHESDLTISYTKIGDYYLPNITLPPEAGDIGIWGRRRKEFLRKHRPILFNELLLTRELSKYLVQVNQEAIEHLESLVEDMKTAQGITEDLKARDPMAWVGAINNIRACAEEIIYAEPVYV